VTKGRIVGAAAVAGTLFFVVHLFMMSSRRLEAVPYTLLLTATALAPVALWGWLLSRLKSSIGRSVLTYVGAAVFAVGFALYYRGGFIHFDALYAAAFIFFPVVQIFALGATYLFARTYERKVKC